MAKLLKKDVKKLIRNLESGRYAKTTSTLTNEKGDAFCCLGVWAAQHGATWVQSTLGPWKPIPKGRTNPEKSQGLGNLSGRLRKGLTPVMLTELAELNDEYPTDKFRAVIDYLKAHVLPKAK